MATLDRQGGPVCKGQAVRKKVIKEEDFMKKTRIHPVTGEMLTRDVRPFKVNVGEMSETVMLPSWYPDGNGDGIHTGKDLKNVDEAVKRLRELQPEFRFKTRGRTHD